MAPGALFAATQTYDSGTWSAVYGYSGTGTADNNTLNLGGTVSVTGKAAGGHTIGSGQTANGNMLNITGDAMVFDAYGGYFEDTVFALAGGEVANNQVTMDSGYVYHIMTGGRSDGGHATNNRVFINGGTVETGVTGGMSSGGAATNNQVTINAGSVDGAHGGYGNNVATGNSVIINGGTVSMEVIGGISNSATNNQVIINAGSVNNVYGALYSADTGNIVTINGGAVNGNVYGSMDGSSDQFSDNILNLNSGTNIPSVGNFEFINFGAIGAAGITLLDVTPTGDAGQKAVKLNTGTNNVTFGGVISGAGSIEKTGAGTLTLSGTNTYSGGTTVSAGTLEVRGTLGSGNYSGAISNAGTLIFNQSAAQALSGVISGSGSLSKSGAGTLTLSGANTYSGLTEVREGTLALSGSGAISPLLALHGGTTFNPGSMAVPLTRLDVHGTGASYAGSLDMSGQTMNFYVPGSTAAPFSAPMLAVGGTADISAAQVNVGIEGGSSPLQQGDSITLIDASGGITGAPANSSSNGSGMQGVTLQYTFDLLAQGNELLAGVSGPGLNPQTKAFSEGYLAGLGLVNQGADMIAGPGVENAVRMASAARAGAATNYGLAAFGAFSGGRSRYNTGSHVDVSGVSLMAGLAYGIDLTPGCLTAGVFFEYGSGSYDTYNSFSNAAFVHGDGDMYHIGGGILGRMDFKDTGPGHIYTEASFRAGGLRNDYASSDLLDLQNRRAGYESSSAYHGLHFGAGYLWNITNKASLDLYSKYFRTRQEGDSVTLSTGDPVEFKAADSSRLRFGSRASYKLSEYISPYIGAAYEHEFDGKAGASTNGFALETPALRGDTGIGELGFTLKPSQTLPLSFDLGAQGYVGKRGGVTGSLQMRYEF